MNEKEFVWFLERFLIYHGVPEIQAHFIIMEYHYSEAMELMDKIFSKDEEDE